MDYKNINNEVYLNAASLISYIKEHKDKTTSDCKDDLIKDIYGLAHDHIIEVIQLYIDYYRSQR